MDEERRGKRLTSADMERIAKRAAEIAAPAAAQIALDRIYADLGKGVFKRLLVMAALIVIGLKLADLVTFIGERIAK